MSLTVDAQTVGTTSASQTVTLQNTSTASMTINSIAISGDFAKTITCRSSLSANASCTITVTFKPTASADRQLDGYGPIKVKVSPAPGR